MTRRKQKKVVRKKRKIPKLDTEFNCPFCHHTKSISIKLDRQNSLAELCCRVCGVSYSMRATRLDEAVDIYSSWIDKCIEVNENDKRNDKLGNYIEVTARNGEGEIERNSLSPPSLLEIEESDVNKKKNNLNKRKERHNDGKEEESEEEQNEGIEKNVSKKRRLHKVLDRYGSSDEEESAEANALFGGDEDD